MRRAPDQPVPPVIHATLTLSAILLKGQAHPQASS